MAKKLPKAQWGKSADMLPYKGPINQPDSITTYTGKRIANPAKAAPKPGPNSKQLSSDTAQIRRRTSTR